MRHFASAFLLASTLVSYAQSPPAAATKAGAEGASGTTVLIDTTMGRLTCRLLSREAPQTSTNFVALASGVTGWADSVTPQTPERSKPFYDGTALFGVTDGLAAGRLGTNQGAAGPEIPLEKTQLTPDRAGILGMRISNGKTSGSQFIILEHADLEYKGRIAPFGLCDAASVAKVRLISHALLAAGNHPKMPLAINRVIVLAEGEPPPPLTPDIPSALVVPHFGPEPQPSHPSPVPNGPTAVIDTTMGRLTCRLFPQTLIGTGNFVGLATGTRAWALPNSDRIMKHKPFYTGLHFERVIPDFMIEQGDLPHDSTGDQGIGFHFANEIVPGLDFDRPGRLAYANFGPGTNASSFFITESPQPELNGKFTIFGQCDAASVTVVQMISRVARDEHNKPLSPVTVKSVTIQ